MDMAKILAGIVFLLMVIAFAVTVVAEDASEQPPQSPATPEEPSPPAPEQPAPTPVPVSEPAAPAVPAEPEPEPEPVIDFDLINVTPDTAEKGDALLKITIRNTGNTVLENLVPVVVGRGFATYDAIPLAALKPGKKGEMTVSGSFAENGDILLTIKLNDKIFYDSVHVTTAGPDAAAQQRAAALREAVLKNLTARVEELKANYRVLENEVRSKKKRYDLSDVRLDDLKKYIFAADAALTSGEIEKIRPLLVQAQGEYDDQRERLTAALKKPFLGIIRDNIVVVSAIIASIITIFTGYEFFKKKQQAVVERIREIKISPSKKAKKENVKKGKKAAAPKKKEPTHKKKTGEKKAETKTDEPSRESAAPEKEPTSDSSS